MMVALLIGIANASLGHAVHACPCGILIYPGRVPPHITRNGFEAGVAASIFLNSLIDLVFEVGRERLVVEEDPGVAEVLVELLLQALDTLYSIISVSVAREHNKSSIGALSGVEDGVLTADVEGRVEVRGGSDDVEAPHVEVDFDEKGSSYEGQGLPVSPDGPAEDASSAEVCEDWCGASFIGLEDG